MLGEGYKRIQSLAKARAAQGLYKRRYPKVGGQYYKQLLSATTSNRPFNELV